MRSDGCGFPANNQLTVVSVTREENEVGDELFPSQKGLSNVVENVVEEGPTICKRKFVCDPLRCDSSCCCGSWSRKKLQGDDNGTLSMGEQVKNARNVVKMRKFSRKRQPNINCRVEAFGRVISEFDDIRRRWVVEMGFGGLLYIVGFTLPRMFCYWLMTRLDPWKGSIKLGDGREYLLTPNHVRWVMGLPNGGKDVPRKVVREEMRTKVAGFREKYGFDHVGIIKKNEKEIYSKGLMVTDEIIERLKGEWKSEDEEEFKMLFLLLSVYMILCPTQSRCLEVDLVPSLTCAMDARSYDWCGLVLEKLMSSVKRFARKFDATGYAGGCGGCSIFVAIFYLDKLCRRPVQWGVWPRLQVWSGGDLRRGNQEDRLVGGGDFGKLQSINAIYGELHPLDSGDKCAPEGECTGGSRISTHSGVPLKTRGRKAASMRKE